MMLFGVATALLISGLIGSLASAGIGIGSAVANRRSQEEANATNIDLAQQANAASAEQAQKQRDWEQMMSSTAHQREMADLKAAGINPLMTAVGSGASTPSGASAGVTSAHVQAPQFDSSQVTNAIQSLNNTMMTYAILQSKNPSFSKSSLNMAKSSGAFGNTSAKASDDPEWLEKVYKKLIK